MNELLYGAYTLALGLALIFFRGFFSSGIGKINSAIWGARYTEEQQGVPKVLFPILGGLFCVIGVLALLSALF